MGMTGRWHNIVNPVVDLIRQRWRKGVVDRNPWLTKITKPYLRKKIPISFTKKTNDMGYLSMTKNQYMHCKNHTRGL